MNKRIEEDEATKTVELKEGWAVFGSQRPLPGSTQSAALIVVSTREQAECGVQGFLYAVRYVVVDGRAYVLPEESTPVGVENNLCADCRELDIYGPCPGQGESVHLEQWARETE